MKRRKRNKKHGNYSEKKRTLAARMKISFVSAVKGNNKKEGSIEIDNKLKKVKPIDNTN